MSTSVDGRVMFRPSQPRGALVGCLAAIILIVLLSGFVATPGALAFSDVPLLHEFAGPVESLALGGIVSGYTDGTFGLYDPVLRAQIAKMVVLAYGYHDAPIDNPGNPTFSDVRDDTSVYPYDYVEEAAKAGFVAGYTGGEFGPYNTLKRIQLVRIIVRAAGDDLADPPLGYVSGFRDVSAADEQYVAAAKYNGLVDGKTATSFDPKGTATRGHAVKILRDARDKASPTTPVDDPAPTSAVSPTTTTPSTRTVSLAPTTTTTTIAGGSTGKVYYVDATAGNDNNNGTSTGTPWKTIAKVNATTFSPGDTILFKRGEVWRERFVLDAGNGSAGAPITFDAYGTGPKPVWSGSADLSSPGAWTNRGGNIWRSSGLTWEVGQLIFNNEASVGWKQTSIGGVDTQGDFYYDPNGDYVDLYSVGNPGTFYTHIEAAQKMDASGGVGGPTIGSNRSYITLRNIVIKNFSYHGLVLGHQANNITIEYCDFAFLGGSYDPGGTVPDGNGIMTFDSHSDINIRYNTFHEIWETAFSIQSNTSSPRALNRIYFDHNTIANAAGAALDYWTVQGTVTADELYWTNNTIYDTGNGMLAARRGGTSPGFKLYAPNTANVTNAHIRNNIWHKARSWYYYFWDGADLSGWDFDYNVFYPEATSAFPDGSSIFVKDVLGYNLAGWKTVSGKDAHSISADPLFVHAAGGDFDLRTGSPAIGSGAF